MSQFEQRENVKFYQHLCKSVVKWHKRFAQGRDSLEGDEHTGRPRTVRTELKIQDVATLVCANRSQMVDEITATEFCLVT
jgi:hypothetical protein